MITHFRNATNVHTRSAETPRIAPVRGGIDKISHDDLLPKICRRLRARKTTATTANHHKVVLKIMRRLVRCKKLRK